MPYDILSSIPYGINLSLGEEILSGKLDIRLKSSGRMAIRKTISI